MGLIGGLGRVAAKIGVKSGLKAAGAFAAVRILKNLGIANDAGRKSAIGRAYRRADLIRSKMDANRAVAILPSKKSPERSNVVSKPSISTMNEQLSELMKVVTSINRLMESQQELVRNKEQQSARIAVEGQLEAGADQGVDAIPEPPESLEIKPLQESMALLVKALDEAIDKLEKLGDPEDDNRGGFWDFFKRRAKRNMGLDPNEKLRKGRKYTGFTADKRLTDLTDAEVATLEKRGISGKGIAYYDKAGKPLSKKAIEAELRAANASRGIFRRAGRRVAQAVDVTEAGIKRAVTKIIGQNAPKLIGKSVAGAGLIFGAWDMINHAAKGDWVGVGLDAAAIGGSTAQLTGVGAAPGAALAITASLTSILRDSYADIFGVPPEQDPQYRQRFNMAMSFASAAVGDMLGMNAQQEKKAQVSQQRPAAPPQVRPPAARPAAQPAISAGTPASRSPPASVSPSSATATPRTSGGGASSGSSPEPAPINAPPPSVASSADQLVPPPANVGDAISTAQMQAEMYTGQTPPPANPSVTIRPANVPTSRNGFEGTGNVHDPIYRGMGALSAQFYA